MTVNTIDFNGKTAKQVNENINTNLQQLDNEIVKRLMPVGEWQADTTYGVNSFATEAGYAGYTLESTSEHLAPQLVGSKQWVYDGAVGDSQVTTKQLIIGQRVNVGAEDGVFIYRYSLRTVVGNHYKVVSINSFGQMNTLIDFDASSTGDVVLNIDPVLANVGTQFDLLTIITQPEITPTIETVRYEYIKTNSQSAPLTGQITHADKVVDQLLVSVTDEQGGDRTAFLAGKEVGDLIEVAGTEWSIQATPVNEGGFFRIKIAPSIRSSASGVVDVNFTTTPEVPITYPIQNDAFVGEANYKGLYSDSGLDNLAQNDNYYGVNLEVQLVEQSDKWHITSYPASNQGGSTILSPDDLDDAESEHKFTKIPLQILDTDLDGNGRYTLDITEDNIILDIYSITQEVRVRLPDMTSEIDYSVTIYNQTGKHFRVIVENSDGSELTKVYPVNGFTIFMNRRRNIENWVLLHIQGATLPVFDTALFGDFNSINYANLGSIVEFIMVDNGDQFSNHPFTLQPTTPYAMLVRVVFKENMMFKQDVFVTSGFDFSANMDKLATRGSTSFNGAVVKPLTITN